MLTEEERAKCRAESKKMWEKAHREALFELIWKLMPVLFWYGMIIATIVKVWWPTLRH